MKLSDRMEAVASYVSPGSTLADVGCDHGYLSIALVSRGIVDYAYAMDINKGPLERAKEHIKEAGLEDKIVTILSDGLKGLCINSESKDDKITKINVVDSIVIAGMGGPLMEKILTQSISVVAKAKEFILQPQSEIDDFRRFLCDNGYQITNENIVYEEGKYYPIIRAIHGTSDYTSEEDYMYGKHFDNTSYPVLIDYIRYHIRTYEELLVTLKNSVESERVRNKISETENKLFVASNCLRRWQHEMQ